MRDFKLRRRFNKFVKDGGTGGGGAGGGRVVKCTGTGVDGATALIIPLDISGEEFTAAFTAATASPLYILLPRITNEAPFYSYENEGYPDAVGMYLIEGHANNNDNFTISGSQDSVIESAMVSDLELVYPDSPNDPMELVIPRSK